MSSQIMNLIFYKDISSTFSISYLAHLTATREMNQKEVKE